MLAPRPPMRAAVRHAASSTSTYFLEVSQSSVEASALPAFSSFLRSHFASMPADIAQVGAPRGRRDRLWITLDSEGPGYAELSRSLAHTGHYTVAWQDSQVMVPVTMRHLSHPAAITLKFLNVPPDCSREGLPEAVLSLAGYNCVPVSPDAPPTTPAPGSGMVHLLGYRLGGGNNAAHFVIDVLAPPDDPHLRRLPPRMAELSSPDDGQFYTLVDNDPLHCLGPAPPTPQVSRGMPAAVQPDVTQLAEATDATGRSHRLCIPGFVFF